MTISLPDTTAINILMQTRIEQLRGGRPRPARGRIPRRN